MSVTLTCPKCKGTLEQVVYANTAVDRCTSCSGIWFDSLEAQDLKKVQGSESIDIGDPNSVTQQSPTGKIDCPKCQTRMTKMVDLKQADLWYEKCPVCYGIWFDAGEFKDFKQDTLIDVVQNLMSKPRF